MNRIIKEDVDNIIEDLSVENCRGKTFLISGATGAIARYFVYTLLELNKKYEDVQCKVLALCRNREKAEELFKGYKDSNFSLFFQSVEEKLLYKGKIDYIIHAASISVTKLFYSNPVETSCANLTGTINLLELAKEKEVESFLFFSSGAIYGDEGQACADMQEDEYYAIDSLDIGNCYALSKKMAENLCVSYCSEFEVPAKIIRIAHTYGPGIDLEDGHVYSDFVKAILNNRDIIIHGTGMQKRAFCYVTDAVKAFFLILFFGKSGEAYNLANNSQFMSIKSLAECLFQGMHIRRDILVIGEKKSGDSFKQVSISTEKLEKLGWRPCIDVVEGFRRTVESMRIIKSENSQ